MRKLFAIIVSFYLIIAPINVAQANAGAFAAPILGIANGIMGASIISKCKLGTTQPSILIYMAAGVAFVASEMIAAKKKAKDIDDISKRLDDLKANVAKGEDYQREAIQAQIDNERSNLKFVQDRRKWMLAIKVLYSVSMALSIVEIILQFPPVFKPDAATCFPDSSHEPITNTFALAYASLMSTNSIGGMAQGVAAGTAIKMLIPKFKLATKIADKAIGILSSSFGRAVFFGASAVLAFIIDADLAKQEEKLKSNIASIEKVKESLPSGGNSAFERDKTFAKAGLTKDASDANYAIKALPKGAELAKNCLSKSSSGVTDFSPEACQNPMKLIRPKFDGSLNTPTLKMAANTGVDFAQALASGDIARADLEAGNLASMAGRIDKIKDDLVKKANEKLKSQGKKPIDVNGEVNRQVAALNDALMKANLGSAQLKDSGAAGEASTSENPAAAVGEVPVNVPAPALPVADDSQGSVSEIIEPEVSEDKPGSLEQKIAELDVDEKDISQETEASIFKQVSNRYFLNYKKIFEKNQIANPPLEPEENK